MAVQRRLGILSQRLGRDSANCAVDSASSLVTGTARTSIYGLGASDDSHFVPQRPKCMREFLQT